MPVKATKRLSSSPPGRRQSHDAIDAIRARIASGRWAAATRLPAERELADELGVSRNALREAVCALSIARILEVRQGDGTYVGSLEAVELLDQTRWATDLIQGPTMLELLAVRRMLEPEVAALAAAHVDSVLEQTLRHQLDRMDALCGSPVVLSEADLAFHEAIARASGNASLRSLLGSLTTRTMQVRLWRELTERAALDDARDEHVRIYEPIVAGQADLARAAALVHVASVESWLRRQLADDANGAGAPLNRAE